MQHRFAVKLFAAAQGDGHPHRARHQRLLRRPADRRRARADRPRAARHQGLGSGAAPATSPAWTSRRRSSSRGGSAAARRPIWVRFVLVPGLTDDPDDIAQIARLRRRPRQRRARRRAAVPPDGPVQVGAARHPLHPGCDRTAEHGAGGAGLRRVSRRGPQGLLTWPSRLPGRPRVSTRIAAIDWMRGLVMILMIVDHASMAFDGQHLAHGLGALPRRGDNGPAGPAFFTRWMTHICAPTFVFLAGLSLAISVERRVARGTPAWRNRSDHRHARRDHRAARSHAGVIRFGLPELRRPVRHRPLDDCHGGAAAAAVAGAACARCGVVCRQ